MARRTKDDYVWHLYDLALRNNRRDPLDDGYFGTFESGEEADAAATAHGGIVMGEYANSDGIVAKTYIWRDGAVVGREIKK